MCAHVNDENVSLRANMYCVYIFAEYQQHMLEAGQLGELMMFELQALSVWSAVLGTENKMLRPWLYSH